MANLILSGDSNVPAMPMTEAEVNHLRRLLAWMRCEWMLDEDAQRGYLSGVQSSAAYGFADHERASAVVQKASDRINQVPAYVRQAVKMLTKAIREHEKRSGIVDDGGSNGTAAPIMQAKQAIRAALDSNLPSREGEND